MWILIIKIAIHHSESYEAVYTTHIPYVCTSPVAVAVSVGSIWSSGVRHLDLRLSLSVSQPDKLYKTIKMLARKDDRCYNISSVGFGFQCKNDPWFLLLLFYYKARVPDLTYWMVKHLREKLNTQKESQKGTRADAIIQMHHPPTHHP